MGLVYSYLHLVDFLMVNVGKDTIHGSYGYYIYMYNFQCIYVRCFRVNVIVHPENLCETLGFQVV